MSFLSLIAYIKGEISEFILVPEPYREEAVNDILPPPHFVHPSPRAYKREEHKFFQVLGPVYWEKATLTYNYSNLASL